MNERESFYQEWVQYVNWDRDLRRDEPLRIVDGRGVRRGR